jgi:hypothetical protein
VAGYLSPQAAQQAQVALCDPENLKQHHQARNITNTFELPVFKQKNPSG